MLFELFKELNKVFPPGEDDETHSILLNTELNTLVLQVWINYDFRLFELESEDELADINGILRDINNIIKEDKKKLIR
jgi:hypothetical protein